MRVPSQGLPSVKERGPQRLICCNGESAGGKTISIGDRQFFPLANNSPPLQLTNANRDVKVYEQADEVGVACSTTADLQEHLSPTGGNEGFGASRADARHCPSL